MEYAYYEALKEVGAAGLLCIGLVIFFVVVHFISDGGFYEKD